MWRFWRSCVTASDSTTIGAKKPVPNKKCSLVTGNRPTSDQQVNRDLSRLVAPANSASTPSATPTRRTKSKTPGGQSPNSQESEGVQHDSDSLFWRKFVSGSLRKSLAAANNGNANNKSAGLAASDNGGASGRHRKHGHRTGSRQRGVGNGNGSGRSDRRGNGSGSGSASGNGSKNGNDHGSGHGSGRLVQEGSQLRSVSKKVKNIRNQTEEPRTPGSKEEKKEKVPCAPGQRRQRSRKILVALVVDGNNNSQQGDHREERSRRLRSRKVQTDQTEAGGIAEATAGALAAELPVAEAADAEAALLDRKTVLAVPVEAPSSDRFCASCRHRCRGLKPRCANRRLTKVPNKIMRRSAAQTAVFSKLQNSQISLAKGLV